MTCTADRDAPISGMGALGKIRTCDTRFRKPLLYPLSYEGLSADLWFRSSAYAADSSL